jgi:dUTP pyrophosphatase
MTKSLLIKYLSDTDPGFPLPAYQTPGSSGLDLRAYLPGRERANGRSLLPGERSLISTGFAIRIPDGFEGQIRARSGLALKYGVHLANGLGTIDSDYIGGLGVLLTNSGVLPYIVEHGARIAQLVIGPYERVTLTKVDDITKTIRNESGFGSTGDF